MFCLAHGGKTWLFRNVVLASIAQPQHQTFDSSWQCPFNINTFVARISWCLRNLLTPTRLPVDGNSELRGVSNLFATNPRLSNRVIADSKSMWMSILTQHFASSPCGQSAPQAEVTWTKGSISTSKSPSTSHCLLSVTVVYIVLCLCSTCTTVMAELAPLEGRAAPSLNNQYIVMLKRDCKWCWEGITPSGSGWEGYSNSSTEHYQWLPCDFERWCSALGTPTTDCKARWAQPRGEGHGCWRWYGHCLSSDWSNLLCNSILRFQTGHQTAAGVRQFPAYFYLHTLHATRVKQAIKLINFFL